MTSRQRLVLVASSLGFSGVLGVSALVGGLHVALVVATAGPLLGAVPASWAPVRPAGATAAVRA